MGLRYLARVLQIEKYSSRGRSHGSALAATYLNIGAVLSSMNKPKESVKMALKATNILLNLKEERLLNGQDLSSGEKVNLVVGHYNLAVGADLGGNRIQAIEKASQGYQFAIMELGLSHPLTEDIGAYLQKLRQKTTGSQGAGSQQPGMSSNAGHRNEYRDHGNGMNKPIAPPTVGNLERSDNLVRGSSSRYETGNSQYPDNSSHIRGDKSYSRNYSGNSNSKPRTEGYEGLSRRAKAG